MINGRFIRLCIAPCNISRSEKEPAVFACEDGGLYFF